MANDKNTTIQDLKEALKKFRDERDWLQFHDPKNVAESISIEAAELQELFLWKSQAEIAEKLKNEPSYRQEVENELADIIINSLNFANALNIDVSQAVLAKTKLNEQKYPKEKARGRAVKYDKL